MRLVRAVTGLGVVACSVACGDSAPAAEDGALAPTASLVAPSFDCATEGLGDVEMRICADPDLARLDLRMDSVGTAVMASAVATRMPEADIDEARARQRGWIGGRNECWKAPGYAAFADVPEYEAIRQCIETEYVMRIARLQADWALAEVTAGPVFWMWDGNPADEFVTTFYDTRPQSARVERGDQTEIMLRSRTASGARYEGYFGRWFWEKGDSAVFSWPEGENRLCVPSGD